MPAPMHSGTFSQNHAVRKGTHFMKHTDGLRNELQMRFFTPDLYLEINSSNAVAVDAAMDAWEKAIVVYKKHLTALLKGMPPQIRHLAKLSLHDWELVSVDADPVTTASTASVEVRHDGQLIVLFYVLWDTVQRLASPENWSFSGERVHWLYDELDRTGNRGGQLIHRILLSDGTTLTIPFSACFVKRIKLTKAFSKSELKSLSV